METPQGNYEKFARFFSKNGFLKKISGTAKRAGKKMVYAALVLYYAATDGKLSLKDKAKIYGALGYFILPADLIPDMTAVLGYTDDLTVFLLTLKLVADRITPETCAQAAARLLKWFPADVAQKDISALNTQLGLPPYVSGSEEIIEVPSCDSPDASAHMPHRNNTTDGGNARKR